MLRRRPTKRSARRMAARLRPASRMALAAKTLVHQTATMKHALIDYREGVGIRRQGRMAREAGEKRSAATALARRASFGDQSAEPGASPPPFRALARRSQCQRTTQRPYAAVL